MVSYKFSLLLVFLIIGYAVLAPVAQQGMVQGSVGAVGPVGFIGSADESNDEFVTLKKWVGTGSGGDHNHTV